jgi:hypothetical protein
MPWGRLETSNRYLLSDVTEVFDFWLQAPIPIVLLKKFVLVEESVKSIRS